MNRIQRQAINAAGLLAVMFAPMTAMAQRQPARSPIFIAVNFHSQAEPKLGMDVAEALRQRMIRLFPQVPLRPGQLRVVTGEEINRQLTAAGYPADSAITTTDLRDLGKPIGADETLEGTVRRTAGGVEVKVKFYWLNNVAAAEILPTFTEKDAGAAGKKAADLYVLARKELPEYDNCRKAIINNEIPAAITAAKAAMLQYDKGVLPRACLMTAYSRLVAEKKMPIDSVMKVAEEILQIDPDNEIAVSNLVEAYMTKGDTAKSIAMSMKLFALNPMNTQQGTAIIGSLMQAGAPDKALTIVQDLLKNNPGDAAIIEMNWKILQATKDWKGALAAGEEMIKFDSSKADTAYFNRQIGAAINDSNPQMVLQLLGRATAKFPKDSRLWLAYSQQLRKQGQIQQALDAAKKAIAIDPKIDQGYATVLSLYTALGQADSAMVFGKQALAGGGNKDQIGNSLLTLIAPAMNKAQVADTATGVSVAERRANWEEVYRMSAVVDTIVQQSATAFYMSFAAYNIAANVLGTIPELQKTDKPKACSELKFASDMVLVVELNMPRGGRTNPSGAGAILNALSGSIKPYIEASKKSLSCK